LGVGGPEVLVILLVALLVFGPKSIPDVARTLAKGMRELRRLSTEFQREMNMLQLDEDDPRNIRSPGPPKRAGEPGVLPTASSATTESASTPAAAVSAAPAASPDVAAEDATKTSGPPAG
jgi:sec-independent protein translocase protein TatB